MTGFAMKVLIADTLSPLVDAVYALPSPSGAKAWAGALACTLQLFSMSPAIRPWPSGWR